MIPYIDFQPLITKTSEILPLSVVIGDKGYYDEDNHTSKTRTLCVWCISARCVHEQYEGHMGDTQNK